MTTVDLIHALQRLRTIGAAALTAAALSAAPAVANAGPGAHGPDGEHLDQKFTAVAGSTLPRLDAASELFELVAQVKGDELTVFIDRYETNEPVLGAELTVESGSLKAVAAFRAEAGDYVVTDAAMLKALKAPGEHALVFTLIAGPDTDLLDGILVTPAADAHAHADGRIQIDAGNRLAVLGAAALALAGGAFWWLRRRRAGTPIVALKGMSS